MQASLISDFEINFWVQRTRFQQVSDPSYLIGYYIKRYIVIKMLIGSLLASHFVYALSVLGPSLVNLIRIASRLLESTHMIPTLV